MRLRKNMKRTAAAALALSMAVSTAAVPASAGYSIDMSGANITGDVEIKQEADGSGTKITISVGGEDKTDQFKNDDEDDKITITGDNTVTKSAATTTAAADAAKDDTKAPETTVTENKDGTVIDYTGKLDAQPDQEVSRPDSQNDQNDPEADRKPTRRIRPTRTTRKPTRRTRTTRRTRATRKPTRATRITRTRTLRMQMRAS